MRASSLLSIPLALVLQLHAVAQVADVLTEGPDLGPIAAASHQVPAPRLLASGTELFSSGPYVTQYGVGAGGANVSEIQAGLQLFGLGHQFALGHRLANDFTVPAGQSWAPSRLRWLAYQGGAPTSGTITGIYTEYTRDDPNGLVIGGDTTTNRMISAVWNGVYRVSPSSISDTSRALIEVSAEMPPELAVLDEGTYWVRVMCDGTSPSGPWAPINVPWDANDNTHQETGIGNGFTPTTQGFGGTAVDTVFWIDGFAHGPPLVYCTAQTNSCAVAPSLDAPSANALQGLGSGGYDVTLAPVNALGGSSFALLVYSTLGAAPTPVLGTYGWHCIDETPGFFFAAMPATQVTGSGCNGSFTFDFGAHLVNQTSDPKLTVGAAVDLQAWYRDAPSQDGARLSNALRVGILP